MKKLKILCLFVGVAAINQAYAETNLFAPKSDSVSKEDLNNVVQQKLEEQKNQMENQFRSELDTINTSQNAQLQTILEQLEALKKSNEELKSNQQNLSDKTERIANEIPAGSYSGFNEPNNSYSIGEVEEELNALIVEEENQETSILTKEDTERLNKEFGEASLVFIGVIDDKKMYRNPEGEYIIKGLDFEYEGSFEEEEADD
tara:strand:+ start:30177 stop:30785 length:609 start_codon:yes stop_codon:yes gene_type:complete